MNEQIRQLIYKGIEKANAASDRNAASRFASLLPRDLGDSLVRNLVYREMAAIGGVSDPVEDYITAIGGFSTAQKGYFRDFKAGMIEDGLWDKCIAIYPFQGSDPAKTGLNLKDPRDNDAAFRITWHGTGLTHDASGVYGFNSAGATYGDTHIIPAEHLLDGDVHLSLFSSDTSPWSVSVLCGVAANPPVNIIEVSGASLNRLLFDSNVNTAGAGRIITPNDAILGTSQGLVTCTRTSLNDIAIYVNDAISATSSANAQTRLMSGITFPLILGGYSLNGAALSQDITTGKFGFFTVGRGLSAGDVANLWARVGLLSYQMGRIND